MKPYFDVIVVIPVGPNSSVAFVVDTLRSYAFHTASTYKIVIADDSHQGLGTAIQSDFPEADVIGSAKPMGGWAGLYIMLSEAYQHALLNYNFKALLKIDTDALVIGSEPEREALALFHEQPFMGIAGQYPLDYHGVQWDLGWPKDRILNGVTTWKFIKRPIANIALRKQYKQAVANGYKAGESVFGGAYFVNYSLVAKLYEQELLPNRKFITLNLGEDHIFALLSLAMGFQLGDLASGNLPFGCAWKGLAAHPEELLQRNKKIIHSTRYWQNMDEEEIRSWFRARRVSTALNP
ncbi:MAG: hypothetical protein WKF70_01455 [Chitinophagaceae bacterium]